MTTISINVDDAELKQLESKAKALGLSSADALLRQTVDRLLETEKERKKRLMQRVVKKNAELYRRLA